MIGKAMFWLPENKGRLTVLKHEIKDFQGDWNKYIKRSVFTSLSSPGLNNTPT